MPHSSYNRYKPQLMTTPKVAHYSDPGGIYNSLYAPGTLITCVTKQSQLFSAYDYILRALL
jgi:hypothetical protein